MYLSLLISFFLLFVQDEPTWKPLFNGKNLEGWQARVRGFEVGENPMNTYRVEDGILKIRYDEYGQFEDRFGSLSTDRIYKNYRLRAEYRFVGETCPGAPEWGYRDSGIMFHAQSPQSMAPDQWFPVALEFNLHGGNGLDERPVGSICTIGAKVEIDGALNADFCTTADVQRTFHGDQWVTLEIDVKDGQISHFVNGEKIMSYSNPQYNPEDELGKTQIKDGQLSLSEGYISIQSNSHPIDFRKIEIMEY